MDQNIKLEIDENFPKSEENINEELFQKTLTENEVQEEYSFDASEFCIVYIEEELTDDQSDHNLNASNIPLDNIRNEYRGEESFWWDVEVSILNNLNEKKVINNANKANTSRVKNEKLFECQYCEYVAKRKVNLEYHLLKHANIKMFKCELCDYGCNHRGNMKKHILRHKKTKLHYCPICDYGCNDARCLKTHIMNHKDVHYKGKEYSHETNLKGSLDKPILTNLNISKCSDSLEYIPKENVDKYLPLDQSIQSTSNKEYSHETNGKGSLDKPNLPHLKVSKCPDSLEYIPKENYEEHLPLVQSIQSTSNKEYSHETNGKGSLDKPNLPHLKVSKCPDSLEYIPKENYEEHLPLVQSIQSTSNKEYSHETNGKGSLDKPNLPHLKVSKCPDSLEYIPKENYEEHLPLVQSIQSTSNKEYSHETNLKGSLDKEILPHLKVSKCPESLEYIPKENYEKYLSSVQSFQSTSKEFKCLKCDFSCDTKWELDIHELDRHSEKKFKCLKCDFRCNEKWELDIHELGRHSDTTCSDSHEYIPKEVFEKHLSLVQSIQSSSKEFKCLKCDFSSNEKWELDIHELGRHCDKKFKCMKCDFICNEKRELDIHELGRHSDNNFKCSLCSFTSDRMGSVKRHFFTHNKRIVDPESKRFQCSECPYRCAVKSSLQTHMLTHSRVKLFRCSQCKYQCNRKQGLQVHYTKHTNSKLYQCPLCSYGCNYKASWKNHLLEKHSVA